MNASMPSRTRARPNSKLCGPGRGVAGVAGRRSKAPSAAPWSRWDSGRDRSTGRGAARGPPTTASSVMPVRCSASAASTRALRRAPGRSRATRLTTASISRPVSPIPSTARRAGVVLRDLVRPEQRRGRRRPAAATGGAGRAPSSRARAAPAGRASRRRAVRRGHLAEHRVEHDVEQLGLAGHVGVERHRADAEPLGDPPHRQRAPGPRRRRARSRPRTIRSTLRPGLGPRVGRFARPPQQRQAARRVAAAAVLGRHVSPSRL